MFSCIEYMTKILTIDSFPSRRNGPQSSGFSLYILACRQSTQRSWFRLENNSSSNTISYTVFSIYNSSRKTKGLSKVRHVEQYFEALGNIRFNTNHSRLFSQKWVDLLLWVAESFLLNVCTIIFLMGNLDGPHLRALSQRIQNMYDKWVICYKAEHSSYNEENSVPE